MIVKTGVSLISRQEQGGKVEKAYVPMYHLSAVLVILFCAFIFLICL